MPRQTYLSISTDNNLVENALRPLALGKKYWSFIGYPAVGQRSAVILSIVISCQRCGIEPLAYRREAISRLPATTPRRLGCFDASALEVCRLTDFDH